MSKELDKYEFDMNNTICNTKYGSQNMKIMIYECIVCIIVKDSGIRIYVKCVHYIVI